MILHSCLLAHMDVDTHTHARARVRQVHVNNFQYVRVGRIKEAVGGAKERLYLLLTGNTRVIKHDINAASTIGRPKTAMNAIPISPSVTLRPRYRLPLFIRLLFLFRDHVRVRLYREPTMSHKTSSFGAFEDPESANEIERVVGAL